MNDERIKALALDAARQVWAKAGIDFGVETVTQCTADAIRTATKELAAKLEEMKQKRDNAYAVLEGEKKSSATLHATINETQDQLVALKAKLEAAEKDTARLELFLSKCIEVIERDGRYYLYDGWFDACDVLGEGDTPREAIDAAQAEEGSDGEA